MLLYACRNIIESFGLWHKVAENVDNYCKILLRSTLKGHTGDGNWPNYWNDITRGDVFCFSLQGSGNHFGVTVGVISTTNLAVSKLVGLPTTTAMIQPPMCQCVCPETVLHCTSDNAVKSRDHVITLSPWTSDVMTFTLCLFVYKHFTDWDRASV